MSFNTVGGFLVRWLSKTTKPVDLTFETPEIDSDLRCDDRFARHGWRRVSPTRPVLILVGAGIMFSEKTGAIQHEDVIWSPWDRRSYDYSICAKESIWWNRVLILKCLKIGGLVENLYCLHTWVKWSYSLFIVIRNNEYHIIEIIISGVSNGPMTQKLLIWKYRLLYLSSVIIRKNVFGAADSSYCVLDCVKA